MEMLTFGLCSVIYFDNNYFNIDILTYISLIILSIIIVGIPSLEFSS